MTTLYKPVLIESVEQAEALPEGTVATSEFDFAREKWCGGWTGADGDALYDHLHMLGWVALVPIEAEEDFQKAGGASVYDGGMGSWPDRTRLVTSWESV